MARTGRPKVEWVTVPCANCGTPQERRKSDMARRVTGRVFCSTECRNAVGSKPRRKSDVACETCGKVFYPINGGPSRFCSKECHDQGQRKDRVPGICEMCGAAFEMKPSQALFWTGRYCSHTCATTAKRRRAVPGRTHNGAPVLMNAQGYLKVKEPTHPKATKGWVLEHRLVMEQAIGRVLETNEHIHHINGNRADNRLENLQIIKPGDHAVLTSANTQARIHRDRDELEQYRRLYGSLPPEGT